MLLTGGGGGGKATTATIKSSHLEMIVKDQMVILSCGFPLEEQSKQNCPLVKFPAPQNSEPCQYHREKAIVVMMRGQPTPTPPTLTNLLRHSTNEHATVEEGTPAL
jgi:hypothetical protein